MNDEWQRHRRAAFGWLVLSTVCIVGIFAGLVKVLIYLGAGDLSEAAFLLVCVAVLIGATHFAYEARWRAHG